VAAIAKYYVLVITLHSESSPREEHDRPIDALLVGLGIRRRADSSLSDRRVRLIAGQGASAQSKDPAINRTRAEVPVYTLPDPLRLADGTKVSDAGTWRARRRPEILKLFEEHVYGKPRSGS